MSVHIGLISVKMRVPGARSLKDKRQVIRSLIDHLRTDYNLSVSEVDDHDKHQAASLVLACVGNDESLINAILDKAVNRLFQDGRVTVLDTELELW